MFQCTSARHWWLSPEDAARCCDPQWRRVLVFGGGANPQRAGGVTMGRAWERIGDSDDSMVLDHGGSSVPTTPAGASSR